MIKNGIFLFILAFFILAYFIPSFSRMQDLRERNVALEQEIISLKQKNKDLAQEKNLLDTDPVYLEKVAREKMGIVREGEVVYKLRPEDNSDK
ncbi:MAG TPA: septum formation initiator family protein [Candidatus Omnitrophota bacterium]|nr:septum formation initiator family protein [Candidatus Omnitrophota bacterium]